MLLSPKSSKLLLRSVISNTIGGLFFVIALWLILKENNVTLTTPIIVCYIISFLAHSTSQNMFKHFTHVMDDEQDLKRAQFFASFLEQMDTYVRQSKLLVEHSEEMVNEWRQQKGLGNINNDLRY